MLTNDLNLPDVFVKAVENSQYEKGDCDIGATTLCGPPLISQLNTEYSPTEDVSDKIWALLGTAVHNILERANTTDVVEQRMYHTFTVGPHTAAATGRPHFTIGYTPDRLSLSENILDDYKIASVWEVIYGVRRERINQLSVYKYLLEQAGYTIDKARIVYILRDWVKSRAGVDDYPMHQVQIIEPELMDATETAAFIDDQWRRHCTHAPCTDEERWKTDDTYAVMMKNRKRALRVLASHEDASEWMQRDAVQRGVKPENVDKQYSIVHRPGQYRRCEDYCNVRNFCPVYKDTNL